jgi:hypothetical protein
MSYIGTAPTIGNFQVCDAISVVNGQASYTMQVGGVNATPQSANHMLVSLNGILQAPNSSFTVSGSTITFASNLVTGDVIDFIQILGDVLDLGVPSDNTVSLAKLTATGTKDATTFLRGDNTFAEPSGGGITEADQWRLASSITSDTDPISANLERVDDATFSKIGTGMSVVNGHWIFPSTGLWQVFGNANIETAAADNVYLKIEASTDGGSSYDSLVQFQQSDSVATYGGHGGGHVFVNVTNTSTYRVKFLCGSLGGAGAGINGNTNFNFTYFTFIRLGDSQ